jgi:multidrug efflux system outer membrane protein
VTKGTINDTLGNVQKKAIALSVLCLLSGCAVTNDYQPPDVNVPSGWRSAYPGAADTEPMEPPGRISVESATALADTAWWESLEDDTLNGLIKIALNENKDLRIAIANVEEFGWRVQSVKSRYYPQAGYGAAAFRDQRSLETATPMQRNADRINDNYEASFSASWELDVWGRIKRATEAARADLLSAEEGKRAVVLTLVSTLAESYIELLSLDSQLEIAKRTLNAREEWVNIFEKKSTGGQISDLELAQVRSAFEEVAVKVPSLESQIAQQENFISILLGSNPMKIERETTLNTLIVPEVPYGLPSNLLQRRPDVLQDEQNLIAANARIGVVQTQYYPSFSLTGLLGYASTELSSFIQGSSSLWAYGLGMAGPLYTGGRIDGEVNQAKALYEQSLNRYLKTIQNAFREVNDTLVALAKLREQKEVEKRHLDVLDDYLRFAHSRYDSGYTPYITVLDSQRQLYRAEISHVRTKSQALKELVKLYKAMGGGWVEKAEGLIEKPNNEKPKNEKANNEKANKSPILLIFG